MSVFPYLRQDPQIVLKVWLGPISVGILPSLSLRDTESKGPSKGNWRAERHVPRRPLTGVLPKESANLLRVVVQVQLPAGTYVPGAAERVQHVYAWVLQLLRQRYKEGEQLMPPPIVANSYRMLSEGLVAFEHARSAHRLFLDKGCDGTGV